MPVPNEAMIAPPEPRTHRLCRHRTVAHVALDDAERPCAVEIPLAEGGVLRIDRVADMRRLRETLAKCEDQVRQAGRGGR